MDTPIAETTALPDSTWLVVAELGPTLISIAVAIKQFGPLKQAALAYRLGCSRWTIARALASETGAKYFARLATGEYTFNEI